MASTPFDQYNYDFSDFASRRAQKLLYPTLAEKLGGHPRGFTLEDTGGTEDDFQRGIDRVLRVPNQGGTTTIRTVQERFRRAKYARYRQLTATEANHASGRTGDFFKLEADLYVYGYIGDDANFIEAIVVDVARMKGLYNKGFLTPDDRRYYQRKKQTIIAFDFDKLDQAGCLLLHLKRSGKIV